MGLRRPCQGMDGELMASQCSAEGRPVGGGTEAPGVEAFPCPLIVRSCSGCLEFRMIWRKVWSRSAPAKLSRGRAGKKIEMVASQNSVAGWQEEDRTPFATVLEELLGGERGSLLELADRFAQAGFGHVMASWSSRGPNLPIGADDLAHILGRERVQDLATLADLPTGKFLPRLARLLPAAVHRTMRQSAPKAQGGSGVTA